MALTPEQEYQLTSGFDTNLHSHDFDRQLTSKSLAQIQEIEKCITVTANYTASYRDDFILVDSTSNTVTVTLPFAKGQKEIVVVRVKGTFGVTIAAQSPNTVNGSASIPITSPHLAVRLKAFEIWSWTSI